MTRVVARINIVDSSASRSYDWLAACVALMTMYVAGNSGIANSLIWLVILITSIFVIFYMSIVYQNKHLLGNASVFLILTVISISFKYFSGYGVTVSLIVSVAGLLGSGSVAAAINKKYFKP